MDIDNPLVDVTAENLEVVIDALTKNDVVREIPFLSTAVGLLKTYRNVRDGLFTEKLKKFLRDIDSIDEHSKQELFNKIATDSAEANKVGRTTLVILERATDLEKASIIATLFIAYGLGHLTSAEFRRICEAVDHAFIDDLIEFLNCHKISEKSKDVFMASLVPSGLTAVTGGEQLGDYGQIYYQITTLGNKFRNAYYNGRKYTGQNSK